MYAHFSTQHNLDLLSQNGNLVIPAEEGELASGLTGQGRMVEPEHIAAYLEDLFAKQNEFTGKKILLTAGPTYEK